MKKLVLFILFIIISVNSYAVLWGKDEEEEAEVAKSEVECHMMLHVSGQKEGNRVFYVYRVPCGEVTQVAIIDENEKSIIHIQNLRMGPSFNYTGENSKNQYLNNNFPNMKMQEIFKN